jgi:phenylacetate-CoA ligase
MPNVGAASERRRPALPAFLMNGSLHSLRIARRILERFPVFAFDIEEFLLAVRAHEDIEKEFHSFEFGNFLDESDWPALVNINKWLSGNQRSQFKFYAQKILDSELAAAPLISKSDIRKNVGMFYPNNYELGQLWSKRTTGSTGQPIEILYSKNFHLDLLNLSPRRILARAGLSIDQGFTILSLSEHQDYAKVITIDPSEAGIVTVHSVVDTASSHPFLEAFDILREIQPICLSSKPSVLENLVALAAKQRNLPKLHSIISGGSYLSDDLRSRLMNEFECPVVSAYGMTEVGIIASECRDRGMHIDKSSVYVEIIDEDGKSVPEGSAGEIVVSRITNEAMPFLRYRTGDYGAITMARCACGVPGPRLKDFVGRKIVCFKLPSGDLFSPTRLNGFMREFPAVTEFQVTQTSIDHIEVKVEVSRTGEAWIALQDKILEYLQAIFPKGISIQVSAAIFAIDSKFQRFQTDL